jgi:hypothetical protein
VHAAEQFSKIERKEAKLVFVPEVRINFVKLA